MSIPGMGRNFYHKINKITKFATGYLMAQIFRANRKDKASLMFGLGMNNNGTGLVLVSIALADNPQVMLPIIFFNLVQHLIDSFVRCHDFALKMWFGISVVDALAAIIAAKASTTVKTIAPHTMKTLLLIVPP